jgi:hypothetical protein
MTTTLPMTMSGSVSARRMPKSWPARIFASATGKGKINVIRRGFLRLPSGTDTLQKPGILPCIWSASDDINRLISMYYTINSNPCFGSGMGGVSSVIRQRIPDLADRGNGGPHRGIGSMALSKPKPRNEGSALPRPRSHARRPAPGRARHGIVPGCRRPRRSRAAIATPNLNRLARDRTVPSRNGQIPAR